MLDVNLVLPILIVVFGLTMVIAELFIGIDSYFDLVLSGTALMIGGGIGIAAANAPIALICTLLLLVLYWLLGRKYVHKLIKTHPRKTNSDKLIGQIIQITRVNNDSGAVFGKIEGEEWRLQPNTSNLDLKPNDNVRVTKIVGAILEVEPI